MKTTTRSAEPITSVAVLHSTPDDFRHELERSHPDVTFHWIADLEQVDAVMSSAKPDAVFAIRKTGFGGPQHRRAAFFPGYAGRMSEAPGTNICCRSSKAMCA